MHKSSHTGALCPLSFTLHICSVSVSFLFRDLYRLGGHSKSFGQTKTTSGEEERINIKPRIITVLRLVPGTGTKCVDNFIPA